MTALETIDQDKILVGSSDETIRLYQVERASKEASKRNGEVDLAPSDPLATYRFEESGVSNLCTLNEYNLFVSSALNRSIDVWDTRQAQPFLILKDVHFDKISAIDRLNHQIFASSGEDGYVNVSCTHDKSLL